MSPFVSEGEDGGYKPERQIELERLRGKIYWRKYANRFIGETAEGDEEIEEEDEKEAEAVEEEEEEHDEGYDVEKEVKKLKQQKK